MKNELYNKYLFLLKQNEMPKFLEKYLKVPSLVRLKNIGYFCGMDYASKDIYNFKEKISRYDHSLTVALLTWKFTKSKKETLAGLFHDIATPCFSHVIDYLNNDYENQESTEEYTGEIVKNDVVLQELLKEDNILVEDIINFKEYSIVDNNRPKLCADRFDGIILTGIAWIKTIQEADIVELVSDLEVYINEDNEKELGFKTKKSAQKAVSINNEIDIQCHSNENNFMMELLAKITNISIQKGIVQYKELYYTEENTLLNKMKNSKIKEIEELIHTFENISLTQIPTTNIENVKVRALKPLVNGIRMEEK